MDEARSVYVNFVCMQSFRKTLINYLLSIFRVREIINFGFIGRTGHHGQSFQAN